MAKEIQDLEMKYICELTGKVRDLTVECGSSRGIIVEREIK